MIRAAAIDLGTNSARILIASFELGERYTAIAEERIASRLGEDAFLTQALQPEPMQRTIVALQRFAELIDKHQVEHVRVVGTATLRNVHNAREFVDRVAKETGLSIDVISGQYEAELIAIGVLSQCAIEGSGYIIDIGGGSTEVLTVSNNTVLAMESLNLGAARAQQEYLHSIPPAEERCKELAAIVAKRVDAVQRPKPNSRTTAVGSSGSIRQLERIMQRRMGDKVELSLAFLDSLVAELMPLRLEKIREIPAIDPERSDLILAAAIILAEVMRALKIEQISTTKTGLKEGLMLEMIRELAST